MTRDPSGCSPLALATIPPVKTAGPSSRGSRRHQKDAEGFVRLDGLRLRTGAKRDAR